MAKWAFQFERKLRSFTKHEQQKNLGPGVVDKRRSVRTMCRVDPNTSAWNVDGDEDRMTTRERCCRISDAGKIHRE